MRKFNEEVHVINRLTGESNLVSQRDLNAGNYFQHFLDDRFWGKRVRCIGLFIIAINETEWGFSLPDTYENQVI